MNKTINGIPKEICLSLTQNAKGYFYVDKVSINGNTEIEVLEKMDKMLKEVKKRLEGLNKEREKKE